MRDSFSVMTPIHFTWLALALASTACAAAPAASRRPNVLIVLTDDQGWGDLAFNGNLSVATPHLDSLARDGAKLGRFYVSPVCAPTRAEFLTGRHHSRTGVRGVQSGAERLNLDERTIAEAFRSAGYATGLFGKWHNGGQYPYHPNARGFAEFYGYTQGHWPVYFDAEVEHNGGRVRSRGYLTDALTTRAMDFIMLARDQPFFCVLSLNTPHSPLQVPDAHFAKFAGAEPAQRAKNPAQEDLAFTRAVLAMTENIDGNVGRVLRQLDQLGIARDTVVLYFSDNGPNSWRWNGGMKGRKGSLDEGGVRSPFVIRWPARIAPGIVVPQITAAIDLFPTLVTLAGIDAGAHQSFDGTDLAPLLLASEPARVAWPDRILFGEHQGKICARFQTYLLDSDGALFDLVADPEQTANVAEKHPAVTTRLSLAIATWKRDVPPRAPDLRPFTVGHGVMPRAELPAGDGAFSGGIERSSRWPNSSYFRNWKSIEDRMTWDIEVATAGRYRAEIYYACPSTDMGAEIELRLGEAAIAAKLTESHEPPLRGAAEDRVVRDESYTRDFRPFSLGVIELPSGRGKLSLQARKIPGAQVMEVEAIALTLLP